MLNFVCRLICFLFGSPIVWCFVLILLLSVWNLVCWLLFTCLLLVYGRSVVLGVLCLRMCLAYGYLVW